ncbi:hypothetical protein JXC34_05020, partial [Candidatus Woesearchaeota archaeon]|nr:hypothetical protein [Candidatus Woesearchaeota archaeon]
MYDIVVGRSQSDMNKYGTRGTILLGKHYVKMGQVTSLSNKVFLEVTRSHVVFVCGKRGGGKCLTGDTLVTMNDGSRIPIRELETTDKDVLSLGNDLKIASFEKSGFYKRKVSELLELNLRSGKKIKLTPEHPLLTVKGWTEAQNLKIKSRIATPRNIAFFGENSMPECQIKLLAYLIAEGHLGNKKVLFTNNDDLIMNDFKSAVNEFDKKLTLRKHGEITLSVVQCSKRKISDPIRNRFGKFSKG